MTLAPASDLAVLRRTNLLQAIMARAMRPVSSTADQACLVEQLLELEVLDVRVEEAIEHYLARLTVTRDSISLLLDLLAETSRPVVRTACVISLLTMWFEDLEDVCQGLTAMS